MSNDKLIRGTLILTLATMVSKVLGLVFVVPFTAMVGVEGYILFEYAYKPYAIMISLATMGLPLAVSKFVSKYNELGDYRMGRLMLKRGMYLLGFTGLFWFALLYFAAPSIADALVGGGDGTGNSVDDVVYVMRMISVALIIVPVMALLRGFFQGYQTMGPTGISQMLEQLVRVLMILVGSFVILYVFKGSVVKAVGFSTFAAFGGAVCGMAVLLVYWKKRKKSLDELVAKQTDESDKKTWPMFRELFSYAIPFVIVGLAIPVYQTVDTFMMNRALMDIAYTLKEAETVNSIVALVQKVILIPNALATAFALSLVPAITQSFTAKNQQMLHSQIDKTFQVICFLTFPAVAGIMMLSDDIYALMFGVEHIGAGGHLLAWYAPVALAYAFITVTSSMLQGMNKQLFAVWSFVVGFLVKWILTVPFIKWFEAEGTVLTTLIGFGLSIGLNVWMIRKEANYSFRQITKQIVYIGGLVAVMVLVLYLFSLTDSWLDAWINSLYLQSLVKGIVGAAVGGFVYLFVSLQTPLFREVFGNRFMLLDKCKWRK